MMERALRPCCFLIYNSFEFLYLSLMKAVWIFICSRTHFPAYSMRALAGPPTDPLLALKYILGRNGCWALTCILAPTPWLLFLQYFRPRPFFLQPHGDRDGLTWFFCSSGSHLIVSLSSIFWSSSSIAFAHSL